MSTKHTPESLWAGKYAALYAEEIEREEARREEAFLDLPRTVCGEQLRLMTPRDLLILNGVGNAFVCGGELEPWHAAMLVWHLNARNDGTRSIRNVVRREVLYSRLSRAAWADVLAGVNGYIDEIFQDAPITTGTDRRPIGTCFLAPLVVRIATRTGWAQSEILDTPLPRLFQYLKAIKIEEHKGPGAAMDFSPSDKLRDRFLTEMNELMAKGEM